MCHLFLWSNLYLFVFNTFIACSSLPWTVSTWVNMRILRMRATGGGEQRSLFVSEGRCLTWPCRNINSWTAAEVWFLLDVNWKNRIVLVLEFLTDCPSEWLVEHCVFWKLRLLIVWAFTPALVDAYPSCFGLIAMHCFYFSAVLAIHLWSGCGTVHAILLHSRISENQFFPPLGFQCSHWALADGAYLFC